jgi:hypothetical protein
MGRTAIFSCAILALLAGSAGAAVWGVNADGTGDAPTIQAAIDSCAAGDTVLVEAGTYSGAGNRDIDFAGKGIVVTSLSGPDVTIVDCGGSAGEYHRGFYFHSGEDTASVLRGFTIRNGYSDEGGGICCRAASPRISGNVVSGNYATRGGGGAYCEGTHSVIAGNTFTHNEVAVWLAAAQDAGIVAAGDPDRPMLGTFPPSGGNICCYADSSRIDSNAISGGRGTLGSAIYCDESFVRVMGNEISENGGYYTEGSVCFLSGSYEIAANTIAENRTWHHGGGLYCSGGTYSIVGNTIKWNSGFGESSGLGGGMYCGPGSYTILNNDILGNWTPGAAGIYIEGSGVIGSNRIIGNQSSYAGPCKAGFVSSSMLSAGADVGGGVTIAGADSLLVTDNTITGNSAPFGGGIACIWSSPEITHNLIVKNGASKNPCGIQGVHEGMGGGIYCENSSPLIAHNTICANTVRDDWQGYAAGAGIFCTSASSPIIDLNIVAYNEVGYGTNAGGIYCEDSLSVPSVSCCDVYANSNADYGGTLPDLIWTSGNFSANPFFCDAESGDYTIHAVSPCRAGGHGDCGLIGARDVACDFMATLLQEFSTRVSPSAVTIMWTLSQAEENAVCFVLRAEAPDGAYRELPAAIAREGLTFTFDDAGFDPGTEYRYRVDVSDGEGRRPLFETSRIVTPALPLSLGQNFPNPFNPSTTISYYLPEDSPVTLAVYDVSGGRVVCLVSKAEKKGRHSVTWDGKDGNGSPVASGIYFSRLTAGKGAVSRKMILLR